MALAGTLRDFSLADIFQLIGLQKKTGILTLTGKDEEARILFMNGMVVGADTNSHRLEDRLGHVLVKSNLISEEELKMALANQANTLQRLGQVLVQKGFIKPEDLRKSLQIQTSQIIYRLFRWEDGAYHFQQERFVDYDQENFEPISSESVLMEGIRMLDEWPLIEKVIPNFEVVVERTEAGRNLKLNVERSFTVNADPEDSFNSLLEGMMEDSTADDSGGSKPVNNLTHEQERVIRLIDGPAFVQDLIDRSGLNEFDTCRSLYDLINMNYVQIVQEELPENLRIIEKEHQLPIWLPVALVITLGALSYFMNWNPVNHLFQSPAQMQESPISYEQETTLRLKHILAAIDIYYIKMGRLPESLNHLLGRGVVRERDLVDPLERPIVYRKSDVDSSIEIYAEGRNLSGHALSSNGQRISIKKVYGPYPGLTN